MKPHLQPLIVAHWVELSSLLVFFPEPTCHLLLRIDNCEEPTIVTGGLLPLPSYPLSHASSDKKKVQQAAYTPPPSIYTITKIH